jgi:hypothetical protein
LHGLSLRYGSCGATLRGQAHEPTGNERNEWNERVMSAGEPARRAPRDGVALDKQIASG